jgi:hypothetical protein
LTYWENVNTIKTPLRFPGWGGALNTNGGVKLEKIIVYAPGTPVKINNTKFKGSIVEAIVAHEPMKNDRYSIRLAIGTRTTTVLYLWKNTR